MLKKVKFFYRKLFIVMFLFSFNQLQAKEGLSSIAFGHNGRPTAEVIVGTPKNWERVDNVEEPFNYKFIHEKGDAEAYLAFSCYQSRPSKGVIFLTSSQVLQKLYGENFLNLIKNVYSENDDDHAFFYFEMPKDGKTEYLEIFSFLDDLKHCIITVVLVSKKWDADVFDRYAQTLLENIGFVNF